MTNKYGYWGTEILLLSSGLVMISTRPPGYLLLQYEYSVFFIQNLLFDNAFTLGVLYSIVIRKTATHLFWQNQVSEQDEQTLTRLGENVYKEAKCEPDTTTKAALEHHMSPVIASSYRTAFANQLGMEKNKDGQYEPNWTTIPEASKACCELVSCKCKNAVWRVANAKRLHLKAQHYMHDMKGNAHHKIDTLCIVQLSSFLYVNILNFAIKSFIWN